MSIAYVLLFGSVIVGYLALIVGLGVSGNL